MLFVYFVVPIVMAFLYRFRGGLFQQWTGIDLGDTKSRILFWGLPVALVLLLHFVWWVALLSGVLAWLSLTVGNFGAIDLGTDKGTPLRDTLMLTLKGLIQGLLPALPLLLVREVALPLVTFSGLLAGCYWLGRALKVNIKGFGANGDFPETGEFIYGLVFGIGLLCSTFARECGLGLLCC